MATKKKLPSQIVAALSSSGGDTGTTYFAGYVLDITDKLRETIDRMYEVLAGDDDIHSIAINVSGFVVPGGDNDGPDDVREHDKEKLEELIDDLQQVEPRAPTAKELRLLKKMEVHGCRGERLVISKYVDPYIVCHEKYGYEEFTSVSIGLLSPAGLIRMRDQMAADRDASIKEQSAVKSNPSSTQPSTAAAAAAAAVVVPTA
jgi:hypothetical protein